MRYYSKEQMILKTTMTKLALFKLGYWMAILIASLASLNGCGEEDEFVSGTYSGTQVFGIGQISSAITIDLKQDGNAVNGSVTPPFQDKLEPITMGRLDGTNIQFDRKESNITYRYVGSITRNGFNTTISGGFGPLGCSDPASGEPCQTDSNGSFTVVKQ
jgi:hypothetical protein